MFLSSFNILKKNYVNHKLNILIHFHNNMAVVYSSIISILLNIVQCLLYYAIVIILNIMQFEVVTNVTV